MKVSKDVGDNRLSVYTPDEDEKELMYKVSDEIIDLINEAGLTKDQEIHLISSLYVSMRDMYGIEGMQHMEGSS